MNKSRFGFLKSRWLWIAVVIIVLLVGYGIYKKKNQAPNFQYATAQIGSVVEQVSVTGTVTPVQKSALAFEKSGTVASISVAVGDAVRAGDPIASLDATADQAAYDSANATLADMSRPLTPDEMAVQETALASAQADALNASHQAFVSAQGALFDYTDAFFSNPQSSNPTIGLQTQSAAIAASIDDERVRISTVLSKWSGELAGASTTGSDGLVSDSVGYLATIKAFMENLAAIVNALTPTGAGLSPAQVAADVSAMNAGLSAVNSAVTSVTSAQTALQSAESAYNLKLAGNSADSIAAQSAKVAQAKAVLDQDALYSPIDGTVTEADPQVGDFVGAGQTAFAVEGQGFEVDAYVAEADIAKVAVGDLASSTLDAYGAYVNFPAEVTAIDPAETVLEGVPTYKVTLVFTGSDSRIKSGMTDNLEILTDEATSTLVIPYRAVTTTATSSTVRLVSADGKSYSSAQVQVGLKGSDGNVQILSGLNPGDKVVTYVAGQ